MRGTTPTRTQFGDAPVAPATADNPRLPRDQRQVGSTNMCNKVIQTQQFAPPGDLHELIVGNLGTVLSGPAVWWEPINSPVSDAVAYQAMNIWTLYDEYVRLSALGYGRVAHEPVTWMIDGDIHKEYQP